MKLSECTPKSAHRKSSGKNQALPTILEIKNDINKAIQDEKTEARESQNATQQPVETNG